MDANQTAVAVGVVCLAGSVAWGFRSKILGWFGFRPAGKTATKPAVLSALAVLRDEAMLLNSEGMMAGANKYVSEYFKITETSGTTNAN